MFKRWRKTPSKDKRVRDFELWIIGKAWLIKMSKGTLSGKKENLESRKKSKRPKNTMKIQKVVENLDWKNLKHFIGQSNWTFLTNTCICKISKKTLRWWLILFSLYLLLKPPMLPDFLPYWIPQIHSLLTDNSSHSSSGNVSKPPLPFALPAVISFSRCSNARFHSFSPLFASPK